MPKLKVAVIYGGQSGEHEVSLLSARAVIAALDRSKYEVLPVKIGKDGRWAVSREHLPSAEASALLFNGGSGARLLAPGASAGALTRHDGATAEKIDVAIPVVHGTGGEDGALQGLLELAGVPYAGAGVLGSALGMDKIAQKMVFERVGLPVAPYVGLTRAEWDAAAAEQGAAEAVACGLELALGGYPLFVKPANTGSSVGVSKAHDRAELLGGLADALRYDRRALVEQAVPEAREIELAALGNGAPRISVPGEIVPSNEFYDYAAKYLDFKSVEHIPAALAPEQAAALQALAARAYAALDCAGFARVDFFVRRDTGAIYINEVNTIPGFTSVSMFAKLWAASGLPFGRLLDEIIRLALERHGERAALQRSYAPAATATEAATAKAAATEAE